MRRGHLWVDWVELGCRGWEIDDTGAELAWDFGESCCETDHAHLDRTTLHLFVGGCRAFYVRVHNDLQAVGIVKYVPMSGYESVHARIDLEGLPLTQGTGTANNIAIEPASWQVVEQQWGHPSGAHITIKHVEKKAPDKKSLIARVREAYQMELWRCLACDKRYRGKPKPPEVSERECLEREDET